MTVGELPVGEYFVILILRNGEKKRFYGKIMEKRRQKYFIIWESPKQSFGSGTKVKQYRRY
jgi:hypothetical protein